MEDAISDESTAEVLKAWDRGAFDVDLAGSG
jgi:hypothetical protein